MQTFVGRRLQLYTGADRKALAHIRQSTAQLDPKICQSTAEQVKCLFTDRGQKPKQPSERFHFLSRERSCLSFAAVI